MGDWDFKVLEVGAWNNTAFLLLVTEGAHFGLTLIQFLHFLFGFTEC
jgi:hypothetical protein